MLLVGPPGSGKTHFVLAALERAIRRHETAQVRLIVPTTSMAQHLAHTLARRGLMVPGDLIQTISELVVSFTPALREPSPAIAWWLLGQAIDAANPQAFAALSQTPGLRTTLAAAIDEFQAAGCDAGALRSLLQPPNQAAFRAVFEKYENLYTEKGYVHPAERLRRAAAEIRGLAGVREIYFDGFLNFSHGQQELVRAIAAHAETLVVTLPQGLENPLPEMPVTKLTKQHRPPVEPIIVSAATPQKEVEEIARRIIDEGRPFHDCGVIVRSSETYAPLFHMVFERFGIPFRLRRPQPLSQHGAIQYLMGLLRAIADGFPGEATLEALTRPGCRIGLHPQMDAFDFRVREELPGQGLRFFQEQAQGLRVVRSYLDKLEPISRWAQEKRPPGQWAERCRELRTNWFQPPSVGDQIGVPRVLELRRLAGALSQFDEAAEHACELLDLEDAKSCTLTQYLEALNNVLQQTLLRIADHRRNVVHILSVFEARQWELPVVFACGLVEGQFPRHHPQDLLFPDADRRRLQARGINLRTTESKQQEEQFLYEIAQTRATEKLVLSYPQQDERSQPQLRSFLLPADRLQDEQPVEVQVRERPAQFRAERPAYLQSSELKRAVSERHDRFSPSSLEAYLQCPYQYFARHTLKLTGRPALPEQRMDVLLMGNIVHRTIARWSEDSSRPIGEVFDQVFEEEQDSARVPAGFRTAVIRNNLRTDVERFAEDKLARRPPEARHQAIEERVEYLVDDTEPPIRITGRIDRYDVFGENLGLVVDYKYSGENRIEVLKKDHDAGMKVQAQLYLLGLEREKGVRPAGMRFLGVRKSSSTAGWVVDGLLPADQIHKGDTRLNEAAFRGLLQEAAERAVKSIDEIRAGRVAIQPHDRDFCRRICQFRDVCRIEL